jgi:phosphate transport system permease protein
MDKKIKWQKINQGIGFTILSLSTIIVVFILFFLVFDIYSKGWTVVDWKFLSDMPTQGMTEGGILPAIIGTVYITLITALFCIPFGISAAIYLSEYARQNFLTRAIRGTIRNLAGVPSIIYGVFGFAIFVQGVNFGTSVLSAGLTLGLLTLPWIITTTEEAINAVPDAYREGALALGATQWQTIRKNVLPYANKGILTGVILGLSRAAGETAPILFTGVVFYLPRLPDSVFDQFMALPYHLYILSTQHQDISQVRPIAYGTALVLITLVFVLNLTAFIIRYRLRKQEAH